MEDPTLFGIVEGTKPIALVPILDDSVGGRLDFGNIIVDEIRMIGS
tara:strand:- start:2248 stop:2385 length:138 start_codon:yes stop_codon:yes gene_type:complete